MQSRTGYEHEAVVTERKIYSIAYSAALLDFRKVTSKYTDLLRPSDYTLAQLAGARIHREGHSELLIQSVRRSSGKNMAIFNSGVLSNPRHNCQLIYRPEGDQIKVEKHPGTV